MSKSAAKYIRNNVSGRTADLLLDVLYTPAIRKQWRNADVLARFLIDTVANAYECENSTTFADNGFDSMEDAIAVYIDANLGDWTQDSFLESSFGRRTEKEIAIRLGRVMLQNKFFEERQRQHKENYTATKQYNEFDESDVAEANSINAEVDAIVARRAGLRPIQNIGDSQVAFDTAVRVWKEIRETACRYEDAFIAFHKVTDFDNFTDVCRAWLAAMDEAIAYDQTHNAMREIKESFGYADPDADHVDAIRMDTCMGKLFEGHEVSFRQNAEFFGFDSDDVEFMRGVVSRSQRNAMDSLSRACTAFISAISKGHLSLSNACTLINQPDLVHVARCIGLTITSRDGKHYHDLDNSHNVDLLRSALGSGYKSDVIDALKDLRATANM